MKTYVLVILCAIVVLAGSTWLYMAQNVSDHDSVPVLGSRDERRVAGHWNEFAKPDDATLRKMLTTLQYEITQHEGTERPFHNEYWDNHEDGIYVDIVSGEPLFSSTDKFDSGTGWPSFLKPINYAFVTEHDDYKLIVHRTEIRSAIADSHLGHIILDGPAENDFVRYCMNSAALRFVPVAEMEAQGYGEFLHFFGE